MTALPGAPTAASSGVNVKYRYRAVTHIFSSLGSSLTEEWKQDYYDGKLDWELGPGDCKTSSTSTPSTPKRLKIVPKVNGNSYFGTASYESGAVTKAALIVSAAAGKKIEVVWDADYTLKNDSNDKKKGPCTSKRQSH